MNNPGALPASLRVGMPGSLLGGLRATDRLEPCPLCPHVLAGAPCLGERLPSAATGLFRKEGECLNGPPLLLDPFGRYPRILFRRLGLAVLHRVASEVNQDITSRRFSPAIRAPRSFAHPGTNKL